MDKFKFYDDYKNTVTENYEYQTDIGDYDVYISDDSTDDSAQIRLVLHENIVGWQNGATKDAGLYTESDVKEFKHYVDGLENELEEHIDPDDPNSPFTSREDWESLLENLF